MSEELLIFLLIPIYIAVITFYIMASWKIYEKAGRPGWNCIVPVYNFYVLLKIVGRPPLWIFLLIIPIVNIVIYIITMIDLAKVFGKGGSFAAGLIFLPMIFYPILGFGDAEYVVQNPVII